MEYSMFWQNIVKKIKVPAKTVESYTPKTIRLQVLLF